MKCRLCKIAVGIAFAIALAAIIYSIMTSGGGAYPAWIKLVTAIGAKFGVTGAALKGLGYALFSAILAAGAALVYLISGIVEWLICIICQAIGVCEECPPRPF